VAYRSRARKTPEPVARIGLITLWKHTMMRRGRVRAVYPNSMSQQTTNPGGTDDLAQELETLLAEIDQSARAPATDAAPDGSTNTPETGAPTPSDPADFAAALPPEEQVEDVARLVNQLAREVSPPAPSTPHPIEPPSVSSPLPAAAPVVVADAPAPEVDDLAGEVDKLLADLTPPPAAIDEAATIDQLDATIATTAEAMIAAHEPRPAPALRPEPVPTAPPAAPASTIVQPAAEATPASSPVPEQEKETGPGIIAVAAFNAASLLSRPFANKPAGVRQTAGWIAVNTLFFAACLWAWALVIRPAGVNQGPEQPFDFRTSGLPAFEEQAAGHGEAHAEHGGADGHAAKGDEHGDKKDDGHGGQDAAKKEPAKPLLNGKQDFLVNKTLSERASPKKAGGKKDDGHGGAKSGH